MTSFHWQPDMAKEPKSNLIDDIEDLLGVPDKCTAVPSMQNMTRQDLSALITRLREFNARVAIEDAVSAERERCAKLAETMGGDFIEADANGDGYREARKNIADAIRARK